MRVEKHKRIFLGLWLFSMICLCTGCRQSAYMEKIYEADSGGTSITAAQGTTEIQETTEKNKTQEEKETLEKYKTQEEKETLEKHKTQEVKETLEKHKTQEILETTETIKETGIVQEEDILVIYICGAVVCPGVYELPQGARVIQAIEAAGGLREDADRVAVNHARCLEDGEQIQILTVEEAKEKGNHFAETIEENQGKNIEEGNTFLDESQKVNINKADVTELMTLPGIGQTKADAIIKYRKTQGAFSSITDIMKVSGIKESVFSKIEDMITV